MPSIQSYNLPVLLAVAAELPSKRDDMTQEANSSDVLLRSVGGRIALVISESIFFTVLHISKPISSIF
jgi:hypothetical protein